MPVQFQGLQPITSKECWATSTSNNQPQSSCLCTIAHLHMKLTYHRDSLIYVVLQHHPSFAEGQVWESSLQVCSDMTETSASVSTSMSRVTPSATTEHLMGIDLVVGAAMENKFNSSSGGLGGALVLR